jgi:hypothetical protein
MGRIHLFEFEDQSWFPSFLRDYGTDFLGFLSNKTRMYKPAIPIIKEGLKKSKTNQIIDLGSGGGGGLIWLNQSLKKDIPNLKIILTDLYPNISAFKTIQKQAENFDFIHTAVDARDVPEYLKGLRTQFLSLHHFKPEDARKILQNAVASGSPIAIFEAQERSLKSLFAMFVSPLTVFLVTPFIRPFKIGRIIFTYLIPLVPLFVWWDGIVSALRTYSPEEMHQLVKGLQDRAFEWKIGRVKSGPGIILYLLGSPKV